MMHPRNPPGAQAVDRCGRWREALGKLESFGQKAFDALIAPIDSDKPGKLAYAIAYKATL